MRIRFMPFKQVKRRSSWVGHALALATAGLASVASLGLAVAPAWQPPDAAVAAGTPRGGDQERPDTLDAMQREAQAIGAPQATRVVQAASAPRHP